MLGLLGRLYIGSDLGIIFLFPFFIFIFSCFREDTTCSFLLFCFEILGDELDERYFWYGLILTDVGNM
jgi:hypothetical protein